MIRYPALFSSFLIIFFIPAYGQITFERWYGGSYGDQGWSVAQTADGGYIIAGGTQSFGAGLGDVYLIKTDSLGDTLWTKTYGGTQDDCGYSLARTSDGGYIIAGHTYSYGAGGEDIYLIKTDTLGDTLWTKTYGGSSNDVGRSVAQTYDGGYIITGSTNSYGIGSTDIYLIKTDVDGDTIWTRRWGYQNSTYFPYHGYSVIQTIDSGYAITGSTSWEELPPSYVALIKTDPAGNTEWFRRYAGSIMYWNGGYSVAQTNDRGYIIAGYTVLGPGCGGGDIFLIKTDSFGMGGWERNYGTNNNDYGYSIALTTDGCYIVTGLINFYGNPPGDLFIMKINSLGDTLWMKIYGGISSDAGYSIAQTTDGGYIAAGMTQSYGAGGDDVYLIKTDSLGMLSGINEKVSGMNTVARRFNISVFPNPFSNRMQIKLQINNIELKKTSLAIYDVTGKLIITFLLPEIPTLLPTVVWDGKDNMGKQIQAGVYFIQFRSGNHCTSKKVVLIRG